MPSRASRSPKTYSVYGMPSSRTSTVWLNEEVKPRTEITGSTEWAVRPTKNPGTNVRTSIRSRAPLSRICSAVTTVVTAGAGLGGLAAARGDGDVIGHRLDVADNALEGVRVARRDGGRRSGQAEQRRRQKAFDGRNHANTFKSYKAFGLSRPLRHSLGQPPAQQAMVGLDSSHVIPGLPIGRNPAIANHCSLAGIIEPASASATSPPKRSSSQRR